MQYQLEQTQWWSSQSILRHQLQQLSPLVTHAFRTTDFYKQLYKYNSLKPNEVLTPEQWADIPLVSRLEIQQAGAKLVSNQLPNGHRMGGEISTSGSTGLPVVVRSTQVTKHFWHAFTLRDHLWHKRNLEGKLCVIRKADKNQGMPPQGSVAKGWGPSTDVIYKTGPSYLLSITASIDEQLDWLQKINPDYILSYPSNLELLAATARKRGIRFSALQQIRTLGEVVTQQTRQQCHDAFNIPLVDNYSCQEAGYLALQCPEHEHYHIQCENVLLEILDDNNKPCKPGETGKVVISSLHNYATPLIRYELGDFAEQGEPCACGRGLPVLTKILGRKRNMLFLPNGKIIWPLVGSDDYRNVADIKQFQLVQTDTESVTVNLVVADTLSTVQKDALTTIIQYSLQHPFKLDYRYMDEIPRSKGGKFEDFVSMLKQHD
ncbi:Coenzyme F390 synthetase [hydrothermal vent metagenome]|uniref:Coenzyme F390 synthetase n=1 Tax=hydrothermal vent metagenome TaxID=652676 RepID=A0A3B0YB22_9ZZZZ